MRNMLKRNLALVALTIALVANVTAFASSKGQQDNQNSNAVKVGELLKLKIEANHPHHVPHIIKARGGGGMLSERDQMNPEGDHIRSQNHPWFRPVREKNVAQSAAEFKALKAAKAFNEEREEKQNCD